MYSYPREKIQKSKHCKFDGIGYKCTINQSNQSDYPFQLIVAKNIYSSLRSTGNNTAKATFTYLKESNSPESIQRI